MRKDPLPKKKGTEVTMIYGIRYVNCQYLPEVCLKCLDEHHLFFAKNPVFSADDRVFFKRIDLLVRDLQKNNELLPQVRWVGQISSLLFYYCWSIVQNADRQCMAAVVCITECACF